MARNY